MTKPEHTIATRIIGRDDQPIKQLVRVYALLVDAPQSPPEKHHIKSPTVRVGSAPEGNDIAVSDPAMSRYHFEITADEHGYRIRDLESTNGTFLDSTRVNDGYLRAGMVIHAGETALKFEPLSEEVAAPLSEKDHFGPLVGRSAAMRQVFATLERVAPTTATLLVEGETGTGKELVAAAIHKYGLCPGGPFVVFDCGAVPRTMLESELFGHERGAFTGAASRRVGVVEASDGGTLFIDELGELPLDLQPKLLRVLEQREVRRVGGSKSIPVNTRVVAATNRDLATEVNSGGFRADLYYRLAVIRLQLPPLRRRPEDVRPLVKHIVGELLKNEPGRADAVLGNVAEDTWRRLEAQRWRGNVRELRNTIQRMLVMSGEIDSPSVVTPVPTREPTHQGPATGAAHGDTGSIDLDVPLIEGRGALVHEYEHAYLRAMLERHGGKIAPAARAAGIDRMYFKRLMKKRGV